jgi:hypothetical protein
MSKTMTLKKLAKSISSASFGKIHCTVDILISHIEKYWKDYRRTFPRELNADTVLTEAQFLLLSNGIQAKHQDDFISKLLWQLIVRDKIIETQKRQIALKDECLKLYRPEGNLSCFEKNVEDSKSGFVYIARQTDEAKLYKIGVAQNITQGKITVKYGNALLQIVASKQAEDAYMIASCLHEFYSRSCVYGEWFCLTSNDLDFLVSELGFTGDAA